MIEEVGRVLALRGDLAEIACERRSACGGCAVNGACGTSLLERWLGRRPLHLLAANTIGARPGDRVVVGVPATALPRAAAVAYLLPLLAMFLGALGCIWLLVPHPSSGTDGPALVGGILGLVLGLRLSARFSARSTQDSRFRPQLLRLATEQPAAVTVTLVANSNPR
ncbi:MAG: Fis family transcriptional regulator [Gammaproteobacteria bacterium]|nr:MAG: Fis family transcriptional regulator [Gammaproteobacteria bacterium]